MRCNYFFLIFSVKEKKTAARVFFQFFSGERRGAGRGTDSSGILHACISGLRRGRGVDACLHARTYVCTIYHCWRKISNYCFTALAIFKTILVFFGVVEARQDYGMGVYIFIHE